MKTLFTMAVFFLTMGLCAEPALIRDLIGTVEIKRPGSAEWEGARQGQEISGDTMISTGFNSTAELVLGNSIITIRPLTRLSISELSHIDDDERISVQLQTGRIRAEITPPREGKTNFTVRSPAATATVRGTVFEFDTLKLRVIEGTVAFSGASGPPVLVDSHRTSYTGGEPGSRAAFPVETAIAELRPELPVGTGLALPPAIPAANSTGPGKTTDPPDPEDLTGIDVTVDF